MVNEYRVATAYSFNGDTLKAEATYWNTDNRDIILDGEFGSNTLMVDKMTDESNTIFYLMASTRGLITAAR